MITIREAKISDLTAVSELFDAYRVFYRKDSNLEGARFFIEERMKLKESIIYLAMDDKVAVGFTQLYPLFSSTRMKRLWLLNDLFVDPDCRGKGISKLLLNRSKQLAKETNAAAVILETEKINQIGNKLYPSSGFILEEETNHYYWNNI